MKCHHPDSDHTSPNGNHGKPHLTIICDYGNSWACGWLSNAIILSRVAREAEWGDKQLLHTLSGHTLCYTNLQFKWNQESKHWMMKNHAYAWRSCKSQLVIRAMLFKSTGLGSLNVYYDDCGFLQSTIVYSLQHLLPGPQKVQWKA